MRHDRVEGAEDLADRVPVAVVDLVGRAPAVGGSVARAPAAVVDLVDHVPAAVRWALAVAIAARTSGRPHRRSGCAARRAERTRNTNRAVRLRSAAADASTPSMTWTTTARSISTISQRPQKRTSTSRPTLLRSTPQTTTKSHNQWKPGQVSS